MGILTEELAAAVNRVSPALSSVAETGISPRNLIGLLLKLMYVESLATVSELAHRMMLPPADRPRTIVDMRHRQRFVQAMGSVPGGSTFLNPLWAWGAGRAAAKDALDQNFYLGPAPVPLTAYQQQILKQRLSNDLVREDAMRRCFAGLVGASDHYFEKLLPAINAGRSVLLFGPQVTAKQR